MTSLNAPVLKTIAASSLFALTLHAFALPVHAYGDLTDEYSLELKGFSREMIVPVQATINKMEGRYPAKKTSRLKQSWYNFLNNTWIESTEPFGYDTIDTPHFGSSGDRL